MKLHIGFSGRCSICLVTLVLLTVVGCTPLSPTPTATAVSTNTLIRTKTPEPSPSNTVTATFTSTWTPPPTWTQTPSPSPTSTPTIAYQPAFGIDYAHPEQYLAPGEQSQISNPSVLDELRAEEQSMAQLEALYHWLKREFSTYSAMGKTIGVVTADQLLAERRLGGCNDHGLVYVAAVRQLGYPAVVANTVSIAWINQFQAGEQQGHIGHIFVEVYLDGKWVLTDPTNGWYVEQGYDPTDPVIPLKGSIAGSSEEIYGFYVRAKGRDMWDYGIHSNREQSQAMDTLASQLDLGSIVYPEYAFERFTSP